MCTVTYLPVYENGEIHQRPPSYVLTSNRDEKTLRPAAMFPEIKEINNRKVVFPLDPQGSGTWIVTNAQGTTICLLNGGFQPHVPNPPYKHSRGLITLDYFLFNTAETFAREYEFEGIEPFTLVVIENGAVHELRWNGESVFKRELDASKPHIWSSVTLYSPETIAKREEWFTQWLKNNAQYSTTNPQLIQSFHRFAGDGDPENDVLMNRSDFMRTVSITSVVHTHDATEMTYIDLIKDTTTKINVTTEYAHS